MATTTFQKILGNLSNNKNVKNLVNDFQKLSKELRQKGAAQINKNMKGNKTVEQAKTQYKKIMTIVADSQKQLDKEVEKALALIRRSAADVEKNLQLYKKMAVDQGQKLEKALSKTQGRKTSKKKVTRKASKKTSRKAV